MRFFRTMRRERERAKEESVRHPHAAAYVHMHGVSSVLLRFHTFRGALPSISDSLERTTSKEDDGTVVEKLATTAHRLLRRASKQRVHQQPHQRTHNSLRQSGRSLELQNEGVGGGGKYIVGRASFPKKKRR